MNPHRTSAPIARLHAGYSLIGLLVTFAIIVVLMAIGMSALNKAVTGNGSAQPGTVRSMKDMLNLESIGQALYVQAQDHDGRFVTPSEISGGPQAQDTTASVFSAMVMSNLVMPEQLVSANEYSGYVEVDEEYDFNAYDPGSGVFWDPGFKADLKRLSHTSFAHMPLFGERFDRKWSTSAGSMFPLMGSRGPKDGIDDPTSWTYGRNKQWGGAMVFGDGHVDFLTAFTPTNLAFELDGQSRPDNIFAMETGPGGDDAIISFTLEMTDAGPKLQFD